MRPVARSLFLFALLAVVVLLGRWSAGSGSRPATTASAPVLRAPEAEGRAARFSTQAARKALEATRPSASEWNRRAKTQRAGVRKDAAITFGAPVYITTNSATEAAEPSIRVDRTDVNERIWVTAPAGGPGVRTGLGSVGGDLVWYSDNNGASWTQAGGPTGTTTIVGGGDTDVAPGFAGEVYIAGLTLANVTLAASCDNGSTFTTNPVSNVATLEDRQWLDAYRDVAKPLLAPDFIFNVGVTANNPFVAFYQIFAPGCAPPNAGPVINTALPGCPQTGSPTADCYQWPGNLALDQVTGDAYVTYNTGNGYDVNDKVVVARIDHGGSAAATQMDAHIFTAAVNRPDTFDSFTAVAVDRVSNVYAVWSERHPATQETATMYTFSTDHGVTWHAPIQVNSTPKATIFPWIVAGASGKIDIVYYGTETPGADPENMDGSPQWKAYMAQSLNATSASPTFSEVEATPVLHQGSICTSGTGCPPGTRSLLDYFEVDMDADCNANIAYTDNFLHGTGATTYVSFVQQNGGSVICGPTAVTVRSFDAQPRRTGVALRWRTASEASLLGFNIFRGAKRLNRVLVRVRGSLDGSSYRYVDRSARRGATYTYRLQGVNRDGSHSWYRARRVTAR